MDTEKLDEKVETLLARSVMQAAELEEYGDEAARHDGFITGLKDVKTTIKDQTISHETLEELKYNRKIANYGLEEITYLRLENDGYVEAMSTMQKQLKKQGETE